MSSEFDAIDRAMGRASYILAKAYRTENIYYRGLLLRFSFDLIDFTVKDNLPYPFTAEEKLKIKHLVQLDIVSKIMMLIEDLAVFSAAFVKDPKGLADLVYKDAGKITTDFFLGLDSFTDEDFYKLLGYTSPQELILKGEDLELILRLSSQNVSEVRRVLNQIGEFRKQHIEMFRRFKHGGFGIVVAGSQAGQPPHPFEKSSVMMVLENPNIAEALPIPHSDKVLEAYRLVIERVQKLLMEILDGQINNAELGISGHLPNRGYSIVDFTPQEKERLSKLIESAYEAVKRPSVKRNIDFAQQIPREKLRWYLGLDAFIEECSKRPFLPEIKPN